MSNLNTVAGRVRAAREKLDWSIPRLADETGLKRQHILMIEQGERKELQSATVLALAKGLRVSADWILTGISAPVSRGGQ